MNPGSALNPRPAAETPPFPASIPSAAEKMVERLHACVRYQNARPWQKSLLDWRRFLRNQSEKYGLSSHIPGGTRTVSTFHMNDFTVVEGELVSQIIASYGAYEPELTEAFLHIVKTGQVVLDIGMHLGYYATLFAVLVGGEGKVHAFESNERCGEFNYALPCKG